ncbi:MAG: methyltransferase domain-containing protein [Acidobacteria bacterium]|nr:methyltransferase domain-containing protein [Acidobacteriota bacterium]
MDDATDRFSKNVENYIKSRPGYPQEIIETLRSDCGLTQDSIVADIGSGTGILSEIFLRNGNPVYGIEPNKEMREAGERLLKNFPRFNVINGRAEETTLPAKSVDFVTAGQAFHWFDRTPARVEFARILKPQGYVVLVWNEMQTESTPLMIAYEQLLQTYAIDYRQVDHRRIDINVIREFFDPGYFKFKQFDNVQQFDYQGLKGRLLSSSYIPQAGHPNYAPLLEGLKDAFQVNQMDGHVRFIYKTLLYFGQLA